MLILDLKNKTPASVAPKFTNGVSRKKSALSLAMLCLTLANQVQSETCDAKSRSSIISTPSAKSKPNTARLASFAPSCTELVESINAEDSLIGVCKFCQLPKSFDAKIERVGDFNTANIERLVRLKPDMVLAVSGQDALVHSLERNKFAVTTFQNSRLSDISANLRTIGKLTNHVQAADARAQEFEKAVSDLKRICSQSMPDKSDNPTVFFCVWPEPLLTAGKSSFLNDAIDACGGKNVAADLMTAYPHYSLERLAVTNPDVVIMPYEAKSAQYLNRAPWNTLKATKEHKLFFLEKDESDRLSRPSTCVVKGLFWLALKLHPEKSSELHTWLKSNSNLENLHSGH